MILQQFGTKLLARARVNHQLDQIFSFPLTVLCAPMGFGKTTAMREYVYVKRLEPIWLSLLGSSGSLAYCWDRLSAQIRKKNTDLANRFDSLGFPGDAPRLAKIVGLICGQEYNEPTLVVVDDYQLIDCRQVADLVTLIAAEEVKNLHIVLLARDTPVLPVTDLEQRRLCCLLGQEVLRFRTEEIGEYFALMEYPVDESVLRHVSCWTDGWISGIYLMLQGMRQGMGLRRGEGINRLLELNIYGAYDAETQDFLLHLSWLGAFTPEQVAYVFDHPLAAAKLLTLIRGNAFITFNNSISAYKMTDLLQEFLQEKARQQRMNPQPLWRRMGEWFLQRGENVLAYDYLYRAGEIETIIRDLDRVEGEDIRFTQFPQIHKIFEGLAPESAFRYPLATLRHLRVKALSEPPSALGVLKKHLQNMEAHFLTIDIPEEKRTRILGEIHNTWIFVAFNNVYEVVAHAEKAVEYFRGRYSCIVSNATEFTFGAPGLLYCYYNKPGSLKERAEYISTHFHILAQAVEGCGSGSEPLALAECALETGDFGKVALYAQKAIHQSRVYRQSSIEICASFTLARLYLSQGKHEEGRRLLLELVERVSREDSSVLNTTAVLCMAYLDACSGRVEAVPQWLRENDMGTGNFMFRGVAFPYIVCLQAVLLSGDFIRLEVLCQEFRKKFDMYKNQLGYIHSDICCAVAKERLYSIEAGCETLERALILASKDDVVMPFAENARSIIPMLRKMRNSRRVPQAFLSRVTACCESYYENVSALLPSMVSLTEREREILQMLAQGVKHKEISDQLFISVATVRYHVKNLYQKLEVNNKISAIQKAKSMELMN